MVDHWKKNGPPVYIAVAAYMGLVKEEPVEGNLEDLANLLSGNGGQF